MALNANYAGVQASSAYSGLAYVAEQSLERGWAKQYGAAHPFYDKLVKKGIKSLVSVGINSYKLIEPVWGGAMVLADFVGVTRLGELTAMGAATTSDGTQAEAPAAFYSSKSIRFTQSELDFAKNGNRGDIVTGRIEEAQKIAIDRFMTDLYDGGDASATSIIALNYVIATGNTIHGIDQATYANWRGNVDTAGGVFDLVKWFGHIQDLRDRYESMPDIGIFARASGGVDIYTRTVNQLKADTLVQVAPNQTGDLSVANYERYLFRGIEMIGDHWATAGEVITLDSSKWVLGGDKMPKLVKNLSPLDSTNAYESMLNWRIALLCKSPRANYRYTGITG